MITVEPPPIILILYTPALLVIVATAVLLLVYENAPELFEVGGVSWRVIVTFLYTGTSDGKVNGPKVGMIAWLYKIVFPFSNENKLIW